MEGVSPTALASLLPLSPPFSAASAPPVFTSAPSAASIHPVPPAPAATAPVSAPPAFTPAPAPSSAATTPFEIHDFSSVTPFERLATDVERALRQWGAFLVPSGRLSSAHSGFGAANPKAQSQTSGSSTATSSDAFLTSIQRSRRIPLPPGFAAAFAPDSITNISGNGSITARSGAGSSKGRAWGAGASVVLSLWASSESPVFHGLKHVVDNNSASSNQADRSHKGSASLAAATASVSSHSSSSGGAVHGPALPSAVPVVTVSHSHSSSSRDDGSGRSDGASGVTVNVGVGSAAHPRDAPDAARWLGAHCTLTLTPSRRLRRLLRSQSLANALSSSQQLAAQQPHAHSHSRAHSRSRSRGAARGGAPTEAERGVALALLSALSLATTAAFAAERSLVVPAAGTNPASAHSSGKRGLGAEPLWPVPLALLTPLGQPWMRLSFGAIVSPAAVAPAQLTVRLVGPPPQSSSSKHKSVAGSGNDVADLTAIFAAMLAKQRRTQQNQLHSQSLNAISADTTSDVVIVESSVYSVSFTENAYMTTAAAADSAVALFHSATNSSQSHASSGTSAAANAALASSVAAHTAAATAAALSRKRPTNGGSSSGKAGKRGASGTLTDTEAARYLPVATRLRARRPLLLPPPLLRSLLFPTATTETEARAGAAADAAAATLLQPAHSLAQSLALLQSPLLSRAQSAWPAAAAAAASRRLPPFAPAASLWRDPAAADRALTLSASWGPLTDPLAAVSLHAAAAPRFVPGTAHGMYNSPHYYNSASGSFAEAGAASTASMSAASATSSATGGGARTATEAPVWLLTAHWTKTGSSNSNGSSNNSNSADDTGSSDDDDSDNGSDSNSDDDDADGDGSAGAAGARGRRPRAAPHPPALATALCALPPLLRAARAWGLLAVPAADVAAGARALVAAKRAKTNWTQRQQRQQ